MHPHLTHIIAQERVAEMRATAERSRRTAAEPLVLADGRRLSIRPIERQDRDRLRRLFMRLTPESRYRRYLSPKPALSERELDHLLDIDHVQHEALAAVDETDGSFVAAARYVQWPDQPGVAEVAIEVADDAQRQGIGTELAIQTLERARANGFTHVTATTLHENAPARALLRAMHFRRWSHDRHEIEFGLELQPELGAPGSTSCRGDPIREVVGSATGPASAAGFRSGTRSPTATTAPSSVGLQAPGWDRPFGRQRAYAQPTPANHLRQSADPTAELA